jgi:hypothetical protein
LDGTEPKIPGAEKEKKALSKKRQDCPDFKKNDNSCIEKKTELPGKGF